MEEDFEYETKKDEYGGFWIRLIAYVIDGIVIGIPLSILSIIIFGVFFGASGAFDAFVTDSAYLEEQMMTEEESISFMISYFSALALTSIVNFILGAIYFAALHASKWQATVGKKLLNLKVTDTNGNRISFWRGFGRYSAKAFLSSIFLIGFFIAAFTDKKQALHDLIAKTVVTKNN